MIYTLILVVTIIGSAEGIGNPNVSVSTQKIEGFSSLETCNATGVQLVRNFRGFLDDRTVLRDNWRARQSSKFSCIQTINSVKNTEATKATTTSTKTVKTPKATKTK